VLNTTYTSEFKQYAADLFEQFQARQKQYLMMWIFQEEIDIN
jgi:hypothetical protein